MTILRKVITGSKAVIKINGMEIKAFEYSVYAVIQELLTSDHGDYIMTPKKPWKSEWHSYAVGFNAPSTYYTFTFK